MNFMRPPRRARSLLNTSRSAIAYCTESTLGRGLPSRRYGMAARPVANAQRAMEPLRPTEFSPVSTAERTFSKMRGAPHMNVGLTSPRFDTMRSSRPSTADAKPIWSWM